MSARYVYCSILLTVCELALGLGNLIAAFVKTVQEHINAVLLA